MSQTSDEPFIMAEDLPDEDSLPCDTDDGETHTSCYVSPEASTFSGNYHSIAASTSVPSSDVFHSFRSRAEDSGSDGTSMDDVDLTSEIHGALEEGYIGLDLGTLHRTLPRQMWARHEKRKPPEKYQPSRDVRRYKSSMKHFIPVRKSNKQREEMPLESAGCFSYITFSWVTRYMMKAYRHGLQPEDVPLCATADGCEQSSLRLEYMWKDELARNGVENASFFRVAIRFIRTRAIAQMMAYCFSLLVGFMGPILFMKRLLEFAEDVESPLWYGAIWAAAVTLNELCRVLSFAVQWSICYRTAIRLRSACLTLLYKKVMRLSSLGNKSVGELINLFANDGSRIFDFACLGPMLIGGPVVAIAGAGYILWLLGPHALIGMLTFAAFYPIQYGISRMTSYFRRKSILVTDQRVRLMHELVSCVKLIKMYAWEKPFSRTIMDIRSKERQVLEKSAYVQSLSIALTPAVPIVATIATFLSHIAAGNNLTAAEAFAIVAFMNSRVRPSLNMVRESLKSFDEARVAWKRIKSVLTMEEMSHYTQKPFDKTVAVSMAEAKLAWNAAESQRKRRKESRKKMRKGDKGNAAEKQALNGAGSDPAGIPSGPVTVLHGVNIRIPKGRLVAICGSVGSGKSSLLSAILGQMRLQEGTVALDGSVAYVPQQAWVMNSSVKDNILFGEAFDAKRYYNVIWNCALNHDISTLPAGDETEVGERGVNLSGGQRQRLAMARALYANRDVYLLDDPLSAVDAHVGKHIFVNCIKMALKEKTVIFVTHQLQYLSECDEVAFMADGRVVDMAPHDSLMKRNPQYQDLINTFLREHEEEQSSSDSETDTKEAANGAVSPTGSTRVAPNRSISVSSAHSGGGEKPSAVPSVDNSIRNRAEGRLTADEKVEEGSVPWTTYHSFIQYGGGYVAAFFVLCAFIINVGSTSFSSYWLAHWINAGSGSAPDLSRQFNETSVNVSEFSAPARSNRISDNPDLPFYQLVYGLFLIAILVSSLLRGIFFMKLILKASSALHNLLFVKVFRSPMRFFDSTPVGRILNLFSKDLDETDSRLANTLENLIQGVLVILSALLFMMLVFPWFVLPFILIAALFIYICRIYRIGIRDLKRLENVSRSPVYSHVAATVNGLSTLHAFSKEREFVTRFMLLSDESTSIFFLFQSSMRWLSVRLDIVTVISLGASAFFVVILHGQVSAAFAGLALAYALNISGMLQYTVRLFSEAEARFTSVQRMQNHIKTLESEAPAVIENRRPAENWPRFGSIKFMNVKMKYRADLPLVLKGINIDIEPKEKIGIVGRTGSGKSSLGMALFRLVELTSGSIKIDGINIAEIGLEDLRSKLSIIPQDPVLFIGTVRYNLDPFQVYSDAAIWEALEQTNMKERIVSLPEKLDSPVVENGENFSVGERQLLCMARALLRHSKILLLDEATAAIDTQTDSLVQQTLRQAFKDCTLLTIAHRLNTVLSCDRILVLDDGKVVEFDKPSVLLSRPHSAFSKMMAAAETSVQPLAL